MNAVFAGRVAFAMLFAAAAATAAPDGGMKILTADIPPMAFMKDGRVTGYCVDVVREIQRRIGDSTAIELQPWARAYRSAQEGANVVLVCPKRTADREHQFKWVGPLFTSQTNFYARPVDRVRIASLEDAKKLSGVPAPRAGPDEARWQLHAHLPAVVPGGATAGSAEAGSAEVITA